MSVVEKSVVKKAKTAPINLKKFIYVNSIRPMIFRVAVCPGGSFGPQPICLERDMLERWYFVQW